MNIGRCSSAIHFLKDRYIIAAGGNLGIGSREKYTNICELLDISKEKKQWTQICSLNFARANTSMAVIDDRHIFIFNGLQSTTRSTEKNCIEYMDIGTLDAKSV